MLMYSYDALSPYISPRTLMIHYNQHYLKYKSNLIKLIGDDDDLVLVLKNIDRYPISDRDDIVYNIGGVINHELYFNSMGPKKIEPIGKLNEQIVAAYGSYDNFKESFIKKAKELVGSGYTFLVINKGSLDIVNLSNQETPYSYDMIPILALDLWEHAYYLDYQNERSRYIDNFFQIVDFDTANRLYEENYEEQVSS